MASWITWALNNSAVSLAGGRADVKDMLFLRTEPFGFGTEAGLPPSWHRDIAPASSAHPRHLAASPPPAQDGGMDPIEAPPQPPVPHFDVALAAPDLSDWLPGNTGVPGFSSFDSGQPGPHVVLVSLVHGNEIAGAIVLDRLLRAGLRP